MSIFYQFFIIVHVYIKQPLIPFKRLIEVQFEINFYMNFSFSLFFFLLSIRDKNILSEVKF